MTEYLLEGPLSRARGVIGRILDHPVRWLAAASEPRLELLASHQFVCSPAFNLEWLKQADHMDAPVFVELPFTVGGGSRFIPSATMFEVADRAQYTAMAFAGLALSAIMAWTLHTRLP